MTNLMVKKLVAARAASDDFNRWPAGSDLVQRASLDVLSAIAAFLYKAEPECVEVARPEAERVSGLIAETAGDAAVCEVARRILDTLLASS